MISFLVKSRGILSPHLKKSLSSTITKPRVVYQGGFDNVLRVLKRVSIFSCTCTLIGVPLLAYSSNHPRMNGIQKWTVAFVVVLFGLTTTVALYIITKPYVARILVDQTGDMLTIEQINFFGKPRKVSLKFSEIVASEKPYATFASSVNPKHTFFVEESPDSYNDANFQNKLFNKIGKNTGKRTTSKY